MKYILLFILSVSILAGSAKDVNNKIILNNKILKSKNKQQQKAKSNMDILAKQIKQKDKEYEKLDKQLSKLTNDIFLNKLKLAKAKEDAVVLEEKAIKITKNIGLIEESLVEEITNQYSASLGIQLAKKNTVDELLDKEVYNLLLDGAKETTLKLNIQYLKIINNKRKIQKQRMQLVEYIKKQEKQKIKKKALVSKTKLFISKLGKKHKTYQKELKNIIKKQNKLKSLLSKLKIIKNKETKKETLKRKRILKEKLAKKKLAKEKARNRKKTAQNKKIQINKRKLNDDIDMEVRNIGSSVKGVKISRYKGRKTISPLKSYTVTKKFGKYYDPVYKIKLFNEALTMKPKKPNAKVYNIFKGKIVYAKKNTGTLENVVIIQHTGGLHTIYSHLDNIPSSLKIGKWIKKGSVIGRVSNTLMFQVTKNSKYINPQELFR